MHSETSTSRPDPNVQISRRAPRYQVKPRDNLGSEESSTLELVERHSICESLAVTKDGISSKEKVDESFDADDSIESRLAKLHLGVEEPDLSEEVLRINDQLQKDELLAMTSIYGDNMFILDKQNGLRSFQIHINLEAPADFNISVKLSSHGDLQARDTNLTDKLLYSFQVQYLPPIIFSCLLPNSYPSHLPPVFTISVQWLNSKSISKCCSMLDTVWVGQTGQEIIYLWVDWLQNCSISYLGFDNEIVLGPYDVKSDRDLRAISSSVSPDVDISSLQSYNDDQRNESFCKNIQECCICFSEYPGSDFISLPCQHFFCLKCMKTYSDMHVKEGTLSQLCCPMTKCDDMIPPGLLKRLLSANEFERWDSLMLQKTLDSMPDVAYCPRCETICVEDEERHAQCTQCFFSFCTRCSERRHLGFTCISLEMKFLNLQKRLNYSQMKDEQQRKKREAMNDILSLKRILRDTQQCPSCRVRISRIDGCNKMVCRNCGTKFCYRCNEVITGYDHFGKWKCGLFPGNEKQRGLPDLLHFYGY